MSWTTRAGLFAVFDFEDSIGPPLTRTSRAGSGTSGLQFTRLTTLSTSDRLRSTNAGLITSTLLGIGGALSGGWVASRVFHVTDLQHSLKTSTWTTALVGAVAVLIAVDLVNDRGNMGSRNRRGAHR